MRYLPIALLLLFLLPYYGFTQDIFTSNKLPLNKVEQVVMPPLDNEKLIANELIRRANKEIPEFAKSHKTRISPQTHGNWEVTADNIAVWRLRIHSEAARSLNFGFSQYHMPEGGKFFIYSIDRKDIKGPFTVADNEEHEQLWTPIIEGEESVLEIQIPLERRADLALNLAYVNHDFMGFSSGLSQDCHLDVNCGTEDGWDIVNPHRDIVQSVSMYSIRGVRACTGFLVNNARQDCTPYYMTAAHCGVSASNAPSIVAYWNYENPTCRTVDSPENARRGQGPLLDFNTGTIFRAENAVTDMTLLELDDPVSESASAYFAGWNNENKSPDSTICIHHPNTEEKRISFSNETSYTGLWTTDEDFIEGGDHIIVPNWDIGSTEGGSSGAPLFNLDGQVIGQLHGGAASCRNKRYDSFGRFFNSWADGENASTRLKDWLDPDNLGLTQLQGYDQAQCEKNIISDVYKQSVCVGDTAVFQLVVASADTITYELEGIVDGIGFEIAMDSSNLNGATLRLFDFDGFQNTENLFQVVAQSDSTQSELFLKLTIFGEELNIVNTLLPKDSSRTVSQTTLFTWEEDVLEVNYEFQLSEVQTFDSLVIDSTNIIQSNLQVDGLEAGTTYYWRVRASNKCSIGEWSEPATFTTATCQRYLSTQVPITISSGGPRTYTSTLKISDQGNIADINVINLKGLHRWISDLDFSLISPAGTEVQLMDRPCFDERDFDLQFDDESTLDRIECPINTGKTYVPSQPLSNFDSELMQGEWTLRFRDNESQDGGSLQSWGVEVCRVSEQFDISVELSQDSFLICEEDAIAFEVNIGTAFQLQSTNVTLEGVPDDIQININSDTTNLFQRNVELSNLNELPEGNYTFTVIVSDNGFLTRKSVQVQVLYPPALRLIFPANEVTNFQQDELVFQWEIEGTANAYKLELASDSLFDNTIDVVTTASTFYSFSDSLSDGTTYFWRVSAENACGGATSSIFSFTTEQIVAVQKWNAFDYKIYPNPSTGVIYIETREAKNQLEIYAANGQLLKRMQISASATVDLSGYSSGIYLMKIVNPQGVILEKIILE